MGERNQQLEQPKKEEEEENGKARKSNCGKLSKMRKNNIGNQMFKYLNCHHRNLNQKLWLSFLVSLPPSCFLNDLTCSLTISCICLCLISFCAQCAQSFEWNIIFFWRLPSVVDACVLLFFTFPMIVEKDWGYFRRAPPPMQPNSFLELV